MGMPGAGGGMSGFCGGLREALAEAAAERGIGRAAAREASHVDDAARLGLAIDAQALIMPLCTAKNIMLAGGTLRGHRAG